MTVFPKYKMADRLDIVLNFLNKFPQFKEHNYFSYIFSFYLFTVHNTNYHSHIFSKYPITSLLFLNIHALIHNIHALIYICFKQSFCIFIFFKVS